MMTEDLDGVAMAEEPAADGIIRAPEQAIGPVTTVNALQDRLHVRQGIIPPGSGGATIEAGYLDTDVVACRRGEHFRLRLRLDDLGMPHVMNENRQLGE